SYFLPFFLCFRDHPYLHSFPTRRSSDLVSLVFEPSPTRWTVRLATSIAYQGVLVAGFNFVVNLWLLRRYRPSALAGFFLTQPIFGVLAAALVTGDPLTLDLLLASAAVAVGIGLTSR